VNPSERLTAKEAKEHIFVKRHHLGLSTKDIPISVTASTDGAAAELQQVREEMKSLLQAKSKLEQQMLEMATELEQVYGNLRKERARADKAEEMLGMCRDQEIRQRS
jgi:predicted  nucleic acid-binding Zn-ribbon protein